MAPFDRLTLLIRFYNLCEFLAVSKIYICAFYSELELVKYICVSMLIYCLAEIYKSIRRHELKVAFGRNEYRINWKSLMKKDEICLGMLKKMTLVNVNWDLLKMKLVDEIWDGMSNMNNFEL